LCQHAVHPPLALFEETAVFLRRDRPSRRFRCSLFPEVSLFHPRFLRHITSYSQRWSSSPTPPKFGTFPPPLSLLLPPQCSSDTPFFRVAICVFQGGFVADVPCSRTGHFPSFVLLMTFLISVYTFRPFVAENAEFFPGAAGACYPPRERAQTLPLLTISRPQYLYFPGRLLAGFFSASDSRRVETPSARASLRKNQSCFCVRTVATPLLPRPPVALTLGSCLGPGCRPEEGVFRVLFFCMGGRPCWLEADWCTTFVRLGLRVVLSFLVMPVSSAPGDPSFSSYSLLRCCRDLRLSPDVGPFLRYPLTFPVVAG